MNTSTTIVVITDDTLPTWLSLIHTPPLAPALTMWRHLTVAHHCIQMHATFDGH